MTKNIVTNEKFKWLKSFPSVIGKTIGSLIFDPRKNDCPDSLVGSVLDY